MGSKEDQAHWDRKYEQGLPKLTEPDPFFVSAYRTYVEPLFPMPGTALDLAGGLGRHALWLAVRKWQVSTVDISEVAINKLRANARQLDIEVKSFALDAAKYHFPCARFDLIVLFYYLDRNLFPKMLSSLNRGGFLVSKMSVRWGPGGEPLKSTSNTLGKSELVSLLPGLEILYHHERPVGQRGVAEFVGRKSALATS
jgi:SAM-dependent methyltransferase